MSFSEGISLKPSHQYSPITSQQLETPVKLNYNSTVAVIQDTRLQNYKNDNLTEAAENETVPQPPLEDITPVKGYEKISFHSEVLNPPAMTFNPHLSSADVGMSHYNMPTLTETMVKSALRTWVANRVCLRDKTAVEMQIQQIEPSSAFQYELETFGEKREVSWAFTPYSGEFVDSSINGQAPQPWDIIATPSAHFQNQKQKLEVPHTATVKPCHSCQGFGAKKCWICRGRGKKLCAGCCNNTEKNGSCSLCFSRGYTSCQLCHSSGRLQCRVCKGRGQLKFFLEITITWTNHKEEKVVEGAKLPDGLLSQVQGQVAFEEERPRLWPITGFPDPGVNQVSKHLVDSHLQICQKEKILMQRQKVTIIPVYQVFYKWNEFINHFFVFGFDNKIYAPSYPQHSWCSICRIL